MFWVLGFFLSAALAQTCPQGPFTVHGTDSFTYEFSPNIVDPTDSSALAFLRGCTYVLQVTWDSVPHPFFITASHAGSGGTTTTPGAGPGCTNQPCNLTYNVPADAKCGNVYYTCSLHDFMSGKVNFYEITCLPPGTGCSCNNLCTTCDPSCGGSCQNTAGSVCGPNNCITCPDGLVRSSPNSVDGSSCVIPKTPTSVVLNTTTNTVKNYLPVHRGLTVQVLLANGSDPSPVPTGTVTFFHNTSTSKTWVKIVSSAVPLDAFGKASVPASELALNGPFGIKAQYSGDSVYAGSTLFESVFFYDFPQDGFYLVQNNKIKNNAQVTYYGTNWPTQNPSFTKNVTYHGWTHRTHPLPMKCTTAINVIVTPPPANPPAKYIGVVGVTFIEKTSLKSQLQRIAVIQTGISTGVGKVLASFCSLQN